MSRLSDAHAPTTRPRRGAYRKRGNHQRRHHQQGAHQQGAHSHRVDPHGADVYVLEPAARHGAHRRRSTISRLAPVLTLVAGLLLVPGGFAAASWLLGGPGGEDPVTIQMEDLQVTPSESARADSGLDRNQDGPSRGVQRLMPAPATPSAPPDATPKSTGQATPTAPGTPGGAADDRAQPGGSRTTEPDPATTAERPTPTPRASRAAPPRKTPSAAPSRTTASAAPSTTSATAAAEAEVVDIVNKERGDAGCDSVRADAALADLARDHSTDMAERDFFSHTNPDGESPWDRAEEAGLNGVGGENIARGQPDAEAVMEAWMDSPGHRANILNCDFEEIGVGVHFGSGGPWWTQVFAY